MVWYAFVLASHKVLPPIATYILNSFALTFDTNWRVEYKSWSYYDSKVDFIIICLKLVIILS